MIYVKLLESDSVNENIFLKLPIIVALRMHLIKHRIDNFSILHYTALYL